MAEFGLPVTVRPAALHEPNHLCAKLGAAQLAQALSYFKARCVAEVVTQGIVIGADTVGEVQGRIYGKPSDRADARRILRALTGTTHRVITGVTFLDCVTGRRLITHDTTRVTMRDVTDLELETYLDTEAWQGKAGAYGIQDRGMRSSPPSTGASPTSWGCPWNWCARCFAIGSSAWAARKRTAAAAAQSAGEHAAVDREGYSALKKRSVVPPGPMGTLRERWQRGQRPW